MLVQDRLHVSAVHSDLDRDLRGDQPGGPVPHVMREGHRLVRQDLAQAGTCASSGDCVTTSANRSVSRRRWASHGSTGGMFADALLMA